MKTVQFKDIPSKVKDLMIRMNGDDYKQNDDIYLDWLHKWDKWSCATDDERLAYAEWRYPKGIKFIPVAPNVFGDKFSEADEIKIFNEGVASNKNWLYFDNKWAEIIEEKEEKIIFSSNDISDSDKKEIERMIKESKNTPSNPEPTFKAGDMVEWARPDAFTKLENSWNKKPVYYTGGIAKSGLYICQDEEGKIIYPSHIRKCDPDKVYREIAKDLIDKWVVVTEKRDELQTAIFTTDGAEQMLIEALKKGKSL